jgi:hypothetical protein
LVRDRTDRRWRPQEKKSGIACAKPARLLLDLARRIPYPNVEPLSNELLPPIANKDRHRTVVVPHVVLALVLALFQSCSFTALTNESVPVWDRNGFGLISNVLSVIGIGYAIYLVLRRSKWLRLLSAALGFFSVATNPMVAFRTADLLRPRGPITTDNWRQHASLHEAAAFADMVDHASSKEMTTRARRFQCSGLNVVLVKAITTDSRQRVRRYSTNATPASNKLVSWYYDESGKLRFIWDQDAQQQTFLDASAQPLWSWWRRSKTDAAYGLQTLNTAHLVLRSAHDAQERFVQDEPGCDELSSSGAAPPEFAPP